jgi:(2R)-sulfolactate sulfo-lyase subunit beta
MASKYSNMTFMGYRRENGRVGVRNHVLILPVDDISNAACEAVANNIKGTLAIPHAYGRLQFGEDLDCISAPSSAPAPTRMSPPWW